MDAVINSIISMEHKAQSIVDSAKEEKRRLVEQTQQQCKKMEADIVKRQEERLGKVAESEKAIIEDKVAEIKKENQAKLERLESRFSDKKMQWIDEICRNIVGGESL